MERVKNQHYVPQSYLERFVSASGDVFVFDKSNMKVFPTGVRNIASERRFYDLPADFSIHPQAVEKVFGKIEGDAKFVIEQMLEEVERDNRFDAAQEERRSILATFLALQNVRTRMFRQNYTQLHERLEEVLRQRHEAVQKHYEAKGEDIEVQPVDLQIPPDRIAVEHAKIMFQSDYLFRAVETLISHIWIIGRNDTSHPLYTSDSPLTRYGHINHPILGGTGLASRGVELDFPLSPRYILILLERTHFGSLLPLTDGDVFSLKPDYVKFYNYLQIHFSRRQIYCSEDKFDYVREIAEKDPDAFNINRSQFQIGNPFS